MIGFLIFGWDSNEIDLGPVDPYDWDLDDDFGDAHLVLMYNYFHLFFLFGVVTSKTYLLMNEYDEVVELEPEDVEEELGEVPIPFMHRWGLALLIGLIVVLGALGGLR